MEFIRRNSDYALRSLIFLAKPPGGKKFTINRIAQKQNLPLFFLRKIFQKLAKGKIVDSKRGPSGGFYLLKRPSEITLKEILESAQGCISLSDCLFKSDACNYSKTCKIRRKLSQFQKRLISLLEKYTLNDFLVD